MIKYDWSKCLKAQISLVGSNLLSHCGCYGPYHNNQLNINKIIGVNHDSFNFRFGEPKIKKNDPENAFLPDFTSGEKIII